MTYRTAITQLPTSGLYIGAINGPPACVGNSRDEVNALLDEMVDELTAAQDAPTAHDCAYKAQLDELAAAVLLWAEGSKDIQTDLDRYETVLILAYEATTTRRASGAVTDQAEGDRNGQ